MDIRNRTETALREATKKPHIGKNCTGLYEERQKSKVRAPHQKAHAPEAVPEIADGLSRAVRDERNAPAPPFGTLPARRRAFMLVCTRLMAEPSHMNSFKA